MDIGAADLGSIAAERADVDVEADARVLLTGILPLLEQADPWSAETTEAAVRAFAEKKDLKLGKVAQPLRAALTGRATSPGVFDVLAVLGREESLARIADQMA